MDIEFEAIAEDQPGRSGARCSIVSGRRMSDGSASEGDQARPRYLTSLRALRAHMPELVPTYERLVELAGNTDSIARFLSSFCPPRYCRRARRRCGRPHGPPAALIRNYDYRPTLARGHHGSHLGGQRVVAMVDCLWGALDGINEAGLAPRCLSAVAPCGRRASASRCAALPAGSRRDAEEAVKILKRVPVP